MYHQDAQIESAVQRIIDIAKAICKDDGVEFEYSTDGCIQTFSNADPLYEGTLNIHMTIKHKSFKRDGE